MGRVILHFSMSLDGFAAGPLVSEAHPMGVAGERLHDWMFPERATPPRTEMDPADSEAIASVSRGVGAVVLGHKTFDVGHKLWGDTPYPVPSFVVTHSPRHDLQMKSAAFTFVTEGVVRAVDLAKAAAGDLDVTVMGAKTARQVVNAGLADAIHLQVIPVLLRSGARLFDDIGGAPIMLRRERILPTAAVTHVDYSIVR